jgi:pseudaminic acid biosynthesis-associated methylase
MTFATEQEAFWAGEFGDAYVDRNDGRECIASNIALFSRALRTAGQIASCIEFGANVGLNLAALKALYPGQEQHAIEINAKAAAGLRQLIPVENVHEVSIVGFRAARRFDLALIKGVLIHINPEVLTSVYDQLHAATGRYLLVAEYYNPQPIEISYRGHKGRLFKRDFCGEILDRFANLRLKDYGFVYHRDPSFPQDDVTWFLMERCHTDSSPPRRTSL